MPIHRLVPACLRLPFTPALVCLAAAWLPAQTARRTPAAMLAQPEVQSAMKMIVANEPHFVDEQIRLCEMSSPPGAHILEPGGREEPAQFRGASVFVEGLGNRPGAAAHPHLVLASHLDTGAVCAKMQGCRAEGT